MALAALSHKFPCLLICGLSFVIASISPASSQTGEEKGPCVDGTYQHENRQCCLCAIGLKVVEHCTENLKYGICEPCENGKYSSHPSSDKFCEPCTICSHPNENLEVDEPCTSSSDAKCRCQADHYCVSVGLDTCKLCHPCKQCGAEGVKVPCIGRNNTVCKEKNEGGLSGGAIFGIVAAVIVIVLLAVGIIIWRKRISGSVQLNGNSRGNPNDLEQPIRDIPSVDLQPHLDDIATAVGWKSMQTVARRSKMPKNAIEACALDCPNDSHEATVKLLDKFLQRESSEASKRLIELLEKSGKNEEAEKVRDILRESR